MNRDIIITGDGSHSIIVPELNVAYHSVHGAIQESIHVFINAGLDPLISYGGISQINIFEVGLGTGLNALLSLIEAKKRNLRIYYEAIELFPLSTEEVKKLNYCHQLGRPELQSSFEGMHTSDWARHIQIDENFILMKRNEDLLTFDRLKPFNLIYFDAFAPKAQPELWTKEVFDKMFSILVPEGILVTYCSKGDVRRAMIAAGLKVEKLQGPPGKREMLRARRDDN